MIASVRKEKKKLKKRNRKEKGKINRVNGGREMRKKGQETPDDLFA